MHKILTQLKQENAKIFMYICQMFSADVRLFNETTAARPPTSRDVSITLVYFTFIYLQTHTFTYKHTRSFWLM